MEVFDVHIVRIAICARSLSTSIQAIGSSLCQQISMRAAPTGPQDGAEVTIGLLNLLCITLRDDG
eukprot:670900-Amphidinium_carterae.2